VLVPTTTLASLLADAAFARVNLVVDIEGAEVDHPRFAGRKPTSRMLATLRALGFVEIARARDVFAFEHPATT
jgi:hypothetical protein